MSKKRAMDHARLDCGPDASAVVWDKQLIARAEGSGHDEICILVVEYTQHISDEDIPDQELTKLFCFVNAKPKFSTFID